MKHFLSIIMSLSSTVCGAQGIDDDLNRLQTASIEMKNCEVKLVYTTLEGESGDKVLNQYDAHYRIIDRTHYHFISDETEIICDSDLVLIISPLELIMILAVTDAEMHTTGFPQIKDLLKTAVSVDPMDVQDAQLAAFRAKFVGPLYQLDVFYNEVNFQVDHLVIYSYDGKQIERLHIDFVEYKTDVVLTPSEFSFDGFIDRSAQGFTPSPRYGSYKLYNLTTDR